MDIIPELCACGCGLPITPRVGHSERKGPRYINHHGGGRPIKPRLLAKVNKTDSCWLWNGHTNNKGYGTICWNGTIWYTHRVSFTLYKGPIPEGLQVCHTCDTPACINPDHLFLGDASINRLDSIHKGRDNRPRGERIGAAKLTPEIITEIRRLHAEGVSYREIGIRLGISKHQAYIIATRRSWKHIP